MCCNKYVTGEASVENYNPAIYDRPSVAVDVVIFTLHEDMLKVLLIKRGVEPFKGKWALPGGFVDKKKDADLEDAAMRELIEETGVKSPYLEQLYTFGSQSRDPRDWTLSVSYFALIPYDKINLKAGSDAAAVRWWPVKDFKVTASLAFDHKQIVQKAVERLYNKLEYTAIAVHLLPKEFTIAQFQNVYETILGTKLQGKVIRRNIDATGILEETGRLQEGKAFRPAKLYRFNTDAMGGLFFPRSIVKAHKDKAR